MSATVNGGLDTVLVKLCAIPQRTGYDTEQVAPTGVAVSVEPRAYEVVIPWILNAFPVHLLPPLPTQVTGLAGAEFVWPLVRS